MYVFVLYQISKLKQQGHGLIDSSFSVKNLPKGSYGLPAVCREVELLV